MNATAAALIIEAARKHAETAVMRTSAETCLVDASECLARGDADYACLRALKSLSYSVGILSPVYREARMACG